MSKRIDQFYVEFQEREKYIDLVCLFIDHSSE